MTMITIMITIIAMRVIISMKMSKIPQIMMTMTMKMINIM